MIKKNVLAVRRKQLAVNNCYVYLICQHYFNYNLWYKASIYSVGFLTVNAGFPFYLVALNIYGENISFEYFVNFLVST